MGRVSEQDIELQSDRHVSSDQGGIGDKEDAQQSQGDADRAQQQIFPGRLDRQSIAVVIDQRGAGKGSRLDGHPQQAEVTGRDCQGHRRKENQQAGNDGPVAAIAAQVQVTDSVNGTAQIEHAGNDQNQP